MLHTVKNSLWRLCACCLLIGFAASVAACARYNLEAKSLTPIQPTISKAHTPTATAQLSLPLDWQTRWLKGIPCQPPCWEGITLGQTTGEEARERLKQNPLIASVETGTYDKYEGLSWVWKDGTSGGYGYYSSQNANRYVYHIRPYYHTVFHLRDIIQSLGEPTHVIATGIRSPYEGNRVYYVTWIVYLSKGFVLYADGKYLDEDKLFGNLEFFTPTVDGLRLVMVGAGRHPEWLVPWQGFKDFDFYCRDATGGRECRGEKMR